MDVDMDMEYGHAWTMQSVDSCHVFVHVHMSMDMRMDMYMCMYMSMCMCVHVIVLTIWSARGAAFAVLQVRGLASVLTAHIEKSADDAHHLHESMVELLQSQADERPARHDDRESPEPPALQPAGAPDGPWRRESHTSGVLYGPAL